MMMMRSPFVSVQLLLVAVFFCTSYTTAATAQRTTTITTNNYSTRMATSIVSRGQGVFAAGAGDVSQLLQAGFTQKAFRRWLERYADDDDPEHAAELIRSYIETSTESIVSAVADAAADTEKWSLDRLSSGNGLIALYYQGKSGGNGNETSRRYRDAFEALRRSVDLQPRDAAGGLWYYVYPDWSYLDGMYSLAPFYTLYAELFGAANASAAAPLDDMLLQLDLLWRYCKMNGSGLLVHGYDGSRTAVWADPATGASPHVWGRSLGWYLMALVDTLGLLVEGGGGGNGTAEKGEKGKKEVEAERYLRARFAELAAAVVRAVDEEGSGAWWQVLDQPGRAGNYIESSGSAMFAYALLKGARLGYLTEVDPSPSSAAAAASSTAGGGSSSWTDVASRAYEYLVDSFVVDNGNGTLGFNGTVSVCSLNSTASYEYYVGRPILYNSVLGSAAFVLASVEYEALGAPDQGNGSSDRW